LARNSCGEGELSEDDISAKETGSMTTRIPLLILVGALALGACARNRDTLPPPPPQAAPAEAPPAAIDQPGTVPAAESVGAGRIPGSQADLVAAAGSDTVLFAFDSYALDEPARQTLGGQAEWLARNASVRVTIEGHADERGTREYNLALGERRANAARAFLAAQGVEASRMAIISYGKERPAVDGQTEEAWAANRRSVTVTTGR
jgi:peptidoglycan-associated lipoprotein